MRFQLPLDQMSLAEKLEVMETLWADLSQHQDALPSPDWHEDVLQERKRLADDGQLKFLDWDTAIAELRTELRGIKYGRSQDETE
jgi:hypothetical protein